MRNESNLVRDSVYSTYYTSGSENEDILTVKPYVLCPPPCIWILRNRERIHHDYDIQAANKYHNPSFKYYTIFLQEFNVLDTQPAEFQPLTVDTITSNQTVFWLVWTTLFLTVLLVLSLMMCLSQRADYVRRLKAATATAYCKCIGTMLGTANPVPVRYRV